MSLDEDDRRIDMDTAGDDLSADQQMAAHKYSRTIVFKYTLSPPTADREC